MEIFNMKKISQKGFTLIELVIVIVIIAILAAFALPRFITLTANARLSAAKGMYGSVQAAAALAHSVSEATGGNPASVTMSGTSVAMTNGYPTAAGIVSALQDTSGFTVTTAGLTTTFDVTSAATPATCRISYTASAIIGNAPTIVTVPNPLTTTSCA